MLISYEMKYIRDGIEYKIDRGVDSAGFVRAILTFALRNNLVRKVIEDFDRVPHYTCFASEPFCNLPERVEEPLGDISLSKVRGFR